MSGHAKKRAERALTTMSKRMCPALRDMTCTSLLQLLDASQLSIYMHTHKGGAHWPADCRKLPTIVLNEVLGVPQCGQGLTKLCDGHMRRRRWWLVKVDPGMGSDVGQQVVVDVEVLGHICAEQGEVHAHQVRHYLVLQCGC